MGQRPPLIINRLDADRLQRLIDAATEKDQMVAELLQDELSHGEIVNPEEIPDNVVSMNSQIQFTDLTRNQSYCQIWCMSIRRRLCRIDHPPVLHPETERYSRPASVG